MKRLETKMAFIKAPKISSKKMSESQTDFQQNFKPLFEEMEAWRKKSASSQNWIA